MSDNKKSILCALAILIVAFIFIEKIIEHENAGREVECETLKKIGAHRGESIMVFGDVPTWKLECLFDNGGQ